MDSVQIYVILPPVTSQEVDPNPGEILDQYSSDSIRGISLEQYPDSLTLYNLLDSQQTVHALREVAVEKYGLPEQLAQ
jgi:hypothetical protein